MTKPTNKPPATAATPANLPPSGGATTLSPAEAHAAEYIAMLCRSLRKMPGTRALPAVAHLLEMTALACDEALGHDTRSPRN